MSAHDLPPMPDGACEICGRFPSDPVHARKYTGRGLGGTLIFWKGRACRQCAICQYRDGLTHCLASGWWGIVPLVVNPVRIAQNAAGLRRALAMPPPLEPALEPPLEPGEPVWRRPAAYLGLVVPVVVIVALVLALGSVGGGSDAPDLAVGTCIAAPTAGTADQAVPMACGSPHAAEVTGTRDGDGASEGKSLCEQEARTYLGGANGIAAIRATGLARLTDGAADGVVCVIVPIGSETFAKPMRGTGRTATK